MVSITGHTMVLAFSEILRDHNRQKGGWQEKMKRRGEEKLIQCES